MDPSQIKDFIEMNTEEQNYSFNYGRAEDNWTKSLVICRSPKYLMNRCNFFLTHKNVKPVCVILKNSFIDICVNISEFILVYPNNIKTGIDHRKNMWKAYIELTYTYFHMNANKEEVAGGYCYPKMFYFIK